MKGSGRFLIQGIQNLPGEIEENFEEPQPRQQVSKIDFNPILPQHDARH